MCLYSRLGDNKKYVANKKNGGVIPTVSDIRVLKVPIKCGRCMECMKQEARKWQMRLLEDVKHHKNGKAVTLTFSDEMIAELREAVKERWIGKGKERQKVRQHLEGYKLDNAIAAKGVERFRERWRKEFGTSIRHWLVTELGHEGTENVHLHGIIYTDEPMEKVRQHWKCFIKVDEKRGWVNGQTVNYLVKYIKKQDLDHKEYKPKVLNSAGIGGDYVLSYNAGLNKYRDRVGQTNEAYRTREGNEMLLTTYWRNKIYTDEEREKLWIEKLDKQERWINGFRIDTSTEEGEKEYYRVLERERERSDRLGYGNDRKNWDRKKYEEDRRKFMLDKRIERANKKKGVYTEKVTKEQNKILGWGMPSRVDTSGG